MSAETIEIDYQYVQGLLSIPEQDHFNTKIGDLLCNSLLVRYLNTNPLQADYINLAKEEVLGNPSRTRYFMDKAKVLAANTKPESVGKILEQILDVDSPLDTKALTAQPMQQQTALPSSYTSSGNSQNEEISFFVNSLPENQRKFFFRYNNGGGRGVRNN